MLIPILITLALVVAAILLVVALRPSTFRVARTATIAAPAAAVFPHVNDFRKWAAWSPYEGRDPAMRKTYEGATAGVGAVYTWNGNGQVGEGRTTITASRPHERIGIRLEMTRPFACDNAVEFTFEPTGAAGDETAVTWAMTGRHNFVGKAIGLVCNLDKMCGRDFERGLAQLKAVVESGGARAPVADAAAPPRLAAVAG